MTSWLLQNANERLAQYRKRDGIQQPRNSSWSIETPAMDLSPVAPNPTNNLPLSLTVYPSVMTAFTRAKLGQLARVYLLAKLLDRVGRGVVSTDDMRRLFCDDNDSPYYVFTWRRMRQILHQGDGVAWIYNKSHNRIILRSGAKIIASLDGSKVVGKQVAFPLEAITGKHDYFMAHVLAAFHSGRTSSAPISRDTVQNLTGIAPRSQYNYQRLAGIETTCNYALKSEQFTKESLFNSPNAFEFKLSGDSYTAYQIPNTYHGNLDQLGRGQRKRINSKINLCTNRDVGNDSKVDKVYYPNAKLVKKSGDLYPLVNTSGKRSHAQFWCIV